MTTKRYRCYWLYYDKCRGMFNILLIADVIVISDMFTKLYN